MPTTPQLLLEQIEAEGVARIVRFVEERASEDLYLDFVTKAQPTASDLHIDDKRNYAKALSGFANSDGGLLVWGVLAAPDPASSDSRDIARELRPITNLAAFVSRLNNLVPTIIKPTAAIRNVVVEESQDYGFVASYVPVGIGPPYRAELDIHRYYKRSGASFFEMEPYELRDVIFRFHYPKIELDFLRETVRRESEQHVYVLRIELRNNGPTTLKNYQVVIWMPEGMVEVTKSLQAVGRQRLDGVVCFGYAWRAHGELNYVFPGESRRIFGQSAGVEIRYIMNHELYDKGYGSKRLYWELYADDMPPQTGSVAFEDERMNDNHRLVEF